MDDFEREPVPELISVAQARALLDDEAAELSDEDVDAIRHHAYAMAHVLIDVFLSQTAPR